MIRVKVSASSANLGPAFDLAGISYNLYNEFTFEKIPSGLEFVNQDKYSNEDNLVYKSFKEVVDKYNLEMIGLRIGIITNIPVSRGLGSSASLIVAGIVAANYFYQLNLTKDDILDIATKIEGHPDNVAPAIYGGLCLSIVDNDRQGVVKYKIESDLKYYVVVPNYELSTEESRKLVKRELSLEESINQMACVSFMVEGLKQGEMGFLRLANNDKIHEPYRKQIIPEYDELKKLYPDSYVVISGAGSSVLVISKKPLEFDKKYNVLDLKINNDGYILQEE